MTFLWALLPFFLAAGIPPPQDPAPASAVTSDLSVLGQKWEKVYRNPALEEDPFAANDQQRENARRQREANRQERELEAARREGSRQQVIRANRDTSIPAPSSFPTPEPAGRRSPSTTYVHRAKVRNDGPKTVRAVVWEYVFADPETKEEVGRHRHRSAVRIRPGKIGELTGRSPSPPARVVRAAEGEKKERAVYSEQVVVRRVEYADGSAWQLP
jgi:hypothetical protein